MSAIHKLNSGVPSMTDTIPFGSSTDDGDLKCTLATLAGVLQSGSGESQTIYESPVSGGTVNALPSIEGVSVHVLLTPLAALASLTVFLPVNAGHEQEVLVTSTQSISTIVVNGNGNGASGSPSSMAAGGYFRMKFDAIADVWVRVG